MRTSADTAHFQARLNALRQGEKPRSLDEVIREVTMQEELPASISLAMVRSIADYYSKECQIACLEKAAGNAKVKKETERDWDTMGAPWTDYHRVDKESITSKENLV